MNIQGLKIGDKIHMRLPGSRIPIVLCYVEAIIADPADRSEESKIIVFRYWSRFKKRWFWKAVPYWELAIYNDWECKL